MERWWSVVSPDPAPVRGLLALTLALLAAAGAVEQWRMDAGGHGWQLSFAVSLLAVLVAFQAMRKRRPIPWTLRIDAHTRLQLAGIAEWQADGRHDGGDVDPGQRGEALGPVDCAIVSGWRCANLVVLRLSASGPARAKGLSGTNSRTPVICCVRKGACGEQAWPAVLRALVRKRRSDRLPLHPFVRSSAFDRTLESGARGLPAVSSADPRHDRRPLSRSSIE